MNYTTMHKTGFVTLFVALVLLLSSQYYFLNTQTNEKISSGISFMKNQGNTSDPLSIALFDEDDTTGSQNFSINYSCLLFHQPFLTYCFKILTKPQYNSSENRFYFKYPSYLLNHIFRI